MMNHCLVLHVLNLFGKKIIDKACLSHYVSRDQQEMAKYDADPLVHGCGNIKGMHDILTNNEKLLASSYKDIS